MSETCDSSTCDKNRLTLKPCPFCGEPAELDTQRGYVSYDYKLGNSVAIYCSRCSADMTLCREDFPQCETDELVVILTEQWNKRPTNTAPDQ